MSSRNYLNKYYKLEHIGGFYSDKLEEPELVTSFDKHFQYDLNGSFIHMAYQASKAFKNRSVWIKYFDSCNTLFIPTKLDAIHRAKSIAALFLLHRLIRLHNNEHTSRYEIVFEHVNPKLKELINLHESYRPDSANHLLQILQAVEPTINLKS